MLYRNGRLNRNRFIPQTKFGVVIAVLIVSVLWAHTHSLLFGEGDSPWWVLVIDLLLLLVARWKEHRFIQETDHRRKALLAE